MSVPISVVILTRDEERNLPACLASLQGLVAEIFVVDSGSTDATVEIACQYGAHVVQHEFSGHNAQWHWALTTLPIQNAWVLGLDADQRLTPELAREMAARFANGMPAHVNGFYVARRNVFRGRWIRWGGYYPKYLLKLFRRDSIRFDDADLLDHHFRIAGPTARLDGDIIEENHKEDSIDFWVRKHLQYAELLATEGVQLEYTQDGVEALADIAFEVNRPTNAPNGSSACGTGCRAFCDRPATSCGATSSGWGFWMARKDSLSTFCTHSGSVSSRI